MWQPKRLVVRHGPLCHGMFVASVDVTHSEDYRPESILEFGHVSQPSKKIESWEMIGETGNSLTPGVVHQNSNNERFKVIELKSDILHDVVTVKITDQGVFWGLDTFHDHLRKLKVGRWLRQICRELS